MTVCATAVPNGATGCIKAIERATHVGLIELGNGFASLDAGLNINNYRVMLQETLKMFVFKKVHNFENTTSDPSITEPDISKTKLITDLPNQSFTFYLQSNFCDYKDVMKVIGVNSNYRVVYFLQDGSLLLVDGLDGSVTAFSALVSAVSKGPLKEIENSFPLYVNHTNYKEFENALMVTPEWDVDDLLAYIPSGSNMRTVTKYNTGTGVLRVSVTERCGDLETGLTASDFAVLRSNVDTPAITSVTEVTGLDGYYDIVLNKESVPTELAVGDQIVIQRKTVASSVVSSISNELAVIVKTA